MEPERKHYPITVEMYHIMADSGAFGPDERLELIDGEIIEMSPIGSRHARCVTFLAEFLNRHFLELFIVSVQNPIVATDRTEPQPDIALLKRRDDLYIDQLPTGSDVALVIEVSDSTVAFDRARKIPNYAAAGIDEAWLIDLESEHVEVHSMRKENAYGLVKIYLRGENAVSETLAELTLPVNDILGQPGGVGKGV
ncbi:MAG: Uma2 family endonuclease [Pyrinomonadaceae bacterium]|nr:Uma2 family endonuclease [Pyrinomonadaceae bacterium]